MIGTILSRNELKKLFYVGRRLELIGCYRAMAEPQARTIHAQKSYGYEMLTSDFRLSELRFKMGQKIEGFSNDDDGAITEIVIWDSDLVAATHYRLLPDIDASLNRFDGEGNLINMTAAEASRAGIKLES
jgi:hypothetical protein